MPEEEKKRLWSVTELNAVLRDVIENSFMPMWAKGEVGNLTIHRSGHVYMTLKDSSSQIRAVFFGGADKCRSLNLREGDSVEVFGRLSVYAARGEYQFNVQSLRLCGTGDLQQRFDELKRKLAAKGYFDAEKKKPIPFIPKCIALVTSPSGAAVKDFLKIALRRFPRLHVRICPAPVQGKGAETKLASAVRFVNRTKCADVIILMRGGGSLEDLWPFNEEVLADAIFESSIPVVSAIGHEIDFTISDFTADLRVPTPSGAAEALIPDLQGLVEAIKDMKTRMEMASGLAFERAAGRLKNVLASKVFSDSLSFVNERSQTVDYLLKDAEKALLRGWENAGNRLGNLETKLDALSPYNVLSRGYSVIIDEMTGKTVRDPVSLSSGAKLRAVLEKGEKSFTVK